MEGRFFVKETPAGRKASSASRYPEQRKSRGRELLPLMDTARILTRPCWVASVGSTNWRADGDDPLPCEIVGKIVKGMAVGRAASIVRSFQDLAQS